jgi:uncharacterized membrane protein HdeD (DUF308 family)
MITTPYTLQLYILLRRMERRVEHRTVREVMSAPSELHSDNMASPEATSVAGPTLVTEVTPAPAPDTAPGALVAATTLAKTPAATPTETPTSAETQAAARAIGQWWWGWIVAGVLWIIASFAILRFGEPSVALVGIVIGVMVLVAGIQDIVVGALASGWKWLWYIVGGLLIVGGVVMLFNPTQTFLVTASILGFIFLLVGVFWMVEAFATMKMNPLWWLGLIAGMIMLGLGFWASGQFFITQAYSLLVFTGIWALLHGITDIVKAFQIKRLGSLPAADMTAAAA